MSKADRELSAQLKHWSPQKEQRLSMSDDLAAPRDLDHFIYFKRTADAAQAKTALESAGFVVLVDNSGKNIALQATRRDALTDANLRAVLTEVITIAVNAKGNYDGCLLYTSPSPRD